MISLLRKSYCCFCVLLSMAFIICGCSNSLSTKESEKSEYLKEFHRLQLNIALVISDKESLPKLAFIAKNNGDQEITIPEFPRNYNGVEIVRPNGKRFLYREVTEFRLIVIKPSESKTWFMDATELLMLENAEGLYHIKWKINKVESKEVLLLKENSKKESRDL